MYLSYSYLNQHKTVFDLMTKRERITISVGSDVLKLLDEKIESGEFFNRSHGFEFCVKKQLK